MSSPEQLNLAISLREETQFDNFFCHSESNALVITALRALISPLQNQHTLIWGPPGSGITHILQALARAASDEQLLVQYLPLRVFVDKGPDQIDPMDFLEGMEANHLICIDDIDACGGNQAWEHALFHFYNRIRDAGHTSVVASHYSPQSLPIELPDLTSRILSGPTYQVQALDDDAKFTVLRSRAKDRGMQMSLEVASYIFSRVSRSTATLFALLETLDQVSLREQRTLTVPFVKSVLERYRF